MSASPNAKVRELEPVPAHDEQPPAVLTREAVVELAGLRVAYALGRESLTVLDVPHWHVARGEQIAIFGASGSGKSTLLHVLAGVIRPSAGSVRVCGVELTVMDEARRDRFRAEHVGYVFQNLNLLQGYTALENVLLGAVFTGGRTDVEGARALLRAMGLADRMRHKPGQMSLGEQQRVAIARALIKRPALVLADEPTGSLDPRNTAQVVRLLREACAAQGSTLMLVTHEEAVLQEFERTLRFTELNRAWADVEAVG